MGPPRAASLMPLLLSGCWTKNIQKDRSFRRYRKDIGDRLNPVGVINAVDNGVRTLVDINLETRKARKLQKASSNLLSKNDIPQIECSSNEQLFRLNLQTDGFGKETSWFLLHQAQQYIGYGPPDGVVYGDLTIYSFQYCLTVGDTYVLAVEDNFGDGMCCERGYGGYEFSLDGTLVYSSNFQRTFNDYIEHEFTVGNIYSSIPQTSPTVRPSTKKTDFPSVASVIETEIPSVGSTASPGTNLPSETPTSLPSSFPTNIPTLSPTVRPTNKPTPNYNFYNEVNGCYGGDVMVMVEVKADEYSNDTSWQIIDYHTGKIRMKQKGYSFKQYEHKSKKTCLPHGLYNFTIWDEFGDGICCRYGDGYFRVWLDGVNVLSGGSFNDNVTEVLNIGFNPKGYMSQRELEYLEAHNSRRKDWHERYNLTYVPLNYSPALAKSAQAWADELLNACGVIGIEHEDFNMYGENLAKNVGQNGWGQLYPADKIVGRWVEFEIGLPYPSNGHLTQALWRASTYLGCGESAKEYRQGMCRVQVCRYGRAGNCDMQGFNATEGENWLIPMLDNYTRCGPNCPPEGCF